MAVKKTQLYASLWASCDKLRGGMDSSEYKDYILTFLFMKYVTDKFKNKGAYEDIKVFDKAHDKDPDPEKRTGCSFDDFIALKGKKNIGEGMDKIIARLADENTDLKGVIDIAHFNDEKKLGSGKEMVDKLTDLISIFQRPLGARKLYIQSHSFCRIVIFWLIYRNRRYANLQLTVFFRNFFSASINLRIINIRVHLQ